MSLRNTPERGKDSPDALNPSNEHLPESVETRKQAEKEKGLHERLRLMVEAEVSRLQTEILKKPEGDKLYYKNIAEIYNTSQFPGYKWIDRKTHEEIPNENIIDWLLQRETLKPDEQEQNMKKFVEAVSKQTDEQRAKTLEEYADDSKTSLFDIQSSQQYERMAGVFLQGNFKRGEILTVNLRGNAKFELYIGLGHILPPSVQKVRVTDNNGNVRIGARDIRDKVGYYDEQGYIPVFSGYKVEILETISEDSDLYKEWIKREADFYKDQKEIVQNAAWKEETISQMIAEGKEADKKYITDWKNIEKILLSRNIKIKINPQTFMVDAQILRSLDGKGADRLGGWNEEKQEIVDPNNKTLKLLERLNRGGKFGQFTLLSGYEFKLGDLERIEKYAADEQLMLKDFEKVFAKSGGLPLSFEDIIKELALAEGAMSLDEVRNHPQFRRRIAENGLPFKTPDDYINIFRNRPRIQLDKLNINQNIYDEGYRLGNLMCARYVSDVLGVRPPDYSASSLFARLVKGGGKIIPEPQNLKKGDVIFFRGTYDNLWHTISHVGYITDVSDGYVVMRHNSGPRDGIRTKKMKWNDPYLRKFYAGVRLA